MAHLKTAALVLWQRFPFGFWKNSVPFTVLHHPSAPWSAHLEPQGSREQNDSGWNRVASAHWHLTSPPQSLHRWKSLRPSVLSPSPRPQARGAWILGHRPPPRYLCPLCCSPRPLRYCRTPSCSDSFSLHFKMPFSYPTPVWTWLKSTKVSLHWSVFTKAWGH